MYEGRITNGVMEAKIDPQLAKDSQWMLPLKIKVINIEKQKNVSTGKPVSNLFVWHSFIDWRRLKASRYEKVNELYETYVGNADINFLRI